MDSAENYVLKNSFAFAGGTTFKFKIAFFTPVIQIYIAI